MDYMGHLAKYPGLADWYAREHSTHKDREQGPSQFVFKLCESLSLSTTNTPLSLADQMDVYFQSKSEALDNYLGAEAIINRCNESLLNIISNIGETAVRSGTSKRFIAAVSNAADKTGIIGLRFLSAWMCLNTGDLQRCVAECEKVDEPFASIYTILGQALLELHEPQQAIDALRVAVKLSPDEILAWFQLAKCYYALNDSENAFRSLLECERISPRNIEIALFQAFIANDSDNQSIQLNAYRNLKPHLGSYAGDAEVVFNLLQLGIKLGDKALLEKCLAEINFERLRTDNRFAQLVSPFLRNLYDRNWMDLSAKFLTGITDAAS